MKTIFKAIFLLVAATLVFSCDKKFQHSPIDDGDVTPPGSVSNVTVENTNGGAIIHYTLPDDPDILYVKAEYVNSQDLEKEVRASAYVDSLIIEGLGDTRERVVRLSVVDHQENVSVAVPVTINPLVPAVETVFSSLSLESGFGGFVLRYENPSRAPVSFYLYTWDPEKPAYTLFNVLSAESASGAFIVKGFESVEQYFAVSVRDKYDNETDFYEKAITPLYEEELDKSKFKLLNLPTDNDWNTNGGSWQMMFDGVVQAWNYGHVDYPVPFPHSFSIDMGVDCKISEIKFWQSQDSIDKQFAHGCPKHFRCYGCPASKDYRDEANWILLYDGYLERPSGGEFGIDPLTEEDLQAAREGHVFLMDQDAPVLRFFRFQSLASWSGMETSLICEFSIFGAPEK